MKKLLVAFFYFLLFGFVALRAQDLDQTIRLAALAKVWGFCKYYHPMVAEGKINWDEILIETIGQVKASGSKDEFNEIINKMILRAGNINFLQFPRIIPEDMKEEPGFQWIEEQSVFKWDTILKLKILQQNYVRVKNKYAEYNDLGQVEYTGENDYKLMAYPSEEYRLLALFRYWNIVNFFFPYKYLIGEDWESVLAEFIPIFIDAADIVLYHLTVSELAARIHDSHANTSSTVLFDYHGEYFPPFEVSTVEEKTVITIIYENLMPLPGELMVGDILQAVEGTDVRTLKQMIGAHVGASNEPSLENRINSFIGRGPTDRVRLTIQRDELKRDLEIPRYDWQTIDRERKNIQKVEMCKILEGNIGYVHMGMMEEYDVDSVMSYLKNTKAIIFDLRCYPGWLVYKLPEYLNPSSRVFAQISGPDPERPGKFKILSSLKTGPASSNPDYYKGKVVVLVNETTISRGEFTCMALQTAPDVTVVGSRTAGADGNVSYLWLPGGIITFFSGLGVYYPDGRETQRVGILPDITITPTIKGIKEGRDEVLEEALKFIQNSVSQNPRFFKNKHRRNP